VSKGGVKAKERERRVASIALSVTSFRSSDILALFMPTAQDDINKSINKSPYT